MTTTTTSTTTYIPPPITNWYTVTSTTTATLWSTTTQTETKTKTVPPECPTTPPCKPRNFQGWTDITITRNIGPATISVNTEKPSWITITNIKFKNAKFLISVGEKALGQTSDYKPDVSAYALTAEEAIKVRSRFCLRFFGAKKNPDFFSTQEGYSWGKFPLPAGQQTVTVSVVDPGTSLFFLTPHLLTYICTASVPRSAVHR